MATLSEYRQAFRARADEDDLHFDQRDKHLAVNVKYYGSYDWSDGLTDEESEAVWNETVEDFWLDAKTIAHEHGYSSLFSEGRSGGWMVPFNQGGTFYHWKGQGGSLGYPRYPDPDNLEDRVTFAAFKADIGALMTEVPQRLKDRATDVIETRDEYPS